MAGPNLKTARSPRRGRRTIAGLADKLILCSTIGVSVTFYAGFAPGHKKLPGVAHSLS